MENEKEVKVEEQNVVKEAPVAENPAPEASVAETPKPAEEKPMSGLGEKPPMTEEERQIKEVNRMNNFNSKEQVVYKMKAEKGANPIGTILFIVILIAFVYFLPDVVDKYGNIFGGNGSAFNHASNTETSTEEPKENPGDEPGPVTPKETEEIYNFEESKTIKRDDLSFMNFVKSTNNGNYELAFAIVNNGDKLFDYNQKYYIEFYSGRDYLGSKLIQSFEPIPPHGSTQFIIYMSKREYDEGKSFKLVLKTPEDYPSIKFNSQEGEYNVLVCSKGNNELKYQFDKELLERIDEETKIPNTLTNYQEELSKAYNTANNLNSIDGITSTVVETNQSGATTKTQFDLRSVQDNYLSNLKQYKYFSYHEKAKIIKYEMTALGYTCS